MSPEKFRRWIIYFKGTSIFFACISLLWIFTGSFDPFGIYDQAFARQFWGSEALPVDAGRAFRFILGPFGATTAAYFIMQYLIIHFCFPARLRWSYYAVVVPFLFWFSVDTGFCAFHRAYFNILFANVPALVGMSPLFFLRKYFTETGRRQ